MSTGQKPLQFQLINAFAATPRAGNQAAVVVIPKEDPRSTDEAYMQAVAKDFNLSETAYLVPLGSKDGVPKYGLRWFTPTDEVPLCGHATLAAATVLFNYIETSATKLEFETKYRGALYATLEGIRGQGVQIGLDLPTGKAEVLELTESYATLGANAAGLRPEDVLKYAEFDFGGPSVIVQLSPDVDLATLQPDLSILRKIPDVTQYTQVLTGKDGKVQVTNRVFAPNLGIDEDPVWTGSAWAVLTGYYLDPAGLGHEFIKAVGGDEKSVLEGRQLSDRGGALTAKLENGRAKIVGRGWRTGYGTLEPLPAA